MTRSHIDSDSDRGLYHLYNVAVRIQGTNPTLLFFNESATVPAVLAADKATGTWIQFEATCKEPEPAMFEANTSAAVLFILPMDNPAHALNDALFSVVLDNLCKRGETGYCFDHYFLANSQPVDGHFGNSNWNQYVHHQLGIVSPESELFRGMDKRNKLFFFPHLMMPKYMRHRFAADWPSLAPFRDFRYIDQSDPLYPLDVLLEMRRRLFGNCFDSEPDQTHDDNSILIYDRGDMHRRRWSNAIDALSLIQKEFADRVSNISFLSEDYGTLKPSEQARLFNQSSLIITPHGGALANLIFCRPGTRVIEFATSALPWGWFHFCARLGMEHVIHKTASLVDHYPAHFEVPPDEIRKLIESRC